MAKNATKFLQVFLENRTLQFVLGNGLRLRFDVDSDAPEDVQDYAKIHGFNQKIRDSASGFSKKGDYSGAYAAMESAIETLKTAWNGRGSSVSDLALAISNLKNLDLADCVAMVRGFDDDKKAQVEGSDSIKKEIDRIKAERLAARIAAYEDDADELDEILGL